MINLDSRKTIELTFLFSSFIMQVSQRPYHSQFTVSIKLSRNCVLCAHSGNRTWNIWISRSTGFLGRSLEWRGLRSLTINLFEIQENPVKICSTRTGTPVKTCWKFWSRNSLQSDLLRAHVLQCVAVCCSVLQCVAVWCSVLQCVAVWCSVLQIFSVVPLQNLSHYRAP